MPEILKLNFSIKNKISCFLAKQNQSILPFENPSTFENYNKNIYLPQKHSQLVIIGKDGQMKSTTFSDKDIERGEAQLNGRQIGGFLIQFFLNKKLKIF